MEGCLEPEILFTETSTAEFAARASVTMAEPTTTTKLKKISVIVIGCGGVGRQLLQHIVNTIALQAFQELYIRVLGVCDSQCLLMASDPVRDELHSDILMSICQLKSSGLSLSQLGFANGDACRVFIFHDISQKLLENVQALGKSIGLVFVDCTASNDTVELLAKSLEFVGCAVLANKKPLISKIELYDKLVSKWRYVRFELMVGAGLPVIVTLNRIIASGDPVYSIMGALIGTLGYLMSELQEGRLLSEVVRSAKALGFTEPDPHDDLGGMDVARKVESLYPSEMGPDVMSVEDFLTNGLPKLDKEIKEKVRNAASKGNVVRYVCKVEKTRCKVGLLELPESSPIGQLKGSESLVEICSRCYKYSPLVIRGAGVGEDTTAAGVLADIVDLQDLFH